MHGGRFVNRPYKFSFFLCYAADGVGLRPNAVPVRLLAPILSSAKSKSTYGQDCRKCFFFYSFSSSARIRFSTVAAISAAARGLAWEKGMAKRLMVNTAVTPFS